MILGIQKLEIVSYGFMLHFLFIYFFFVEKIGQEFFSKIRCHESCVESINRVAPLEQDPLSKPIPVEEGGHREEGKHE